MGQFAKRQYRRYEPSTTNRVLVRRLAEIEKRSWDRELREERHNRRLRLLGILILLLSMVAALAAMAAFALQISSSTTEYQPIFQDEIANTEVIERRLDNVDAMLERMQIPPESPNLSSQFEPIQAELSDLNRKMETLINRHNGSSQFSFVFSIVSGFAWWGVVFLFSAPLLASSLSSASWDVPGFRTFSVIVFLIGLTGSVFAIGVLYAELASDFVEQFGWALPPLMVGTAFATFASVTLRDRGTSLNLVQSSILSVVSVALSAVFFLVVMPLPEACKTAFSLYCKTSALFSDVEISTYLLSFAALLPALFFYLVSALVVLRRAVTER